MPGVVHAGLYVVRRVPLVRLDSPHDENRAGHPMQEGVRDAAQ